MAELARKSNFLILKMQFHPALTVQSWQDPTLRPLEQAENNLKHHD